MIDPIPLRFATFNIRYPAASDGQDLWDIRKDFVAQVIRAIDADVIGLQECYRAQANYLAGELPEYEHIGVGRDDGRDAGEMVPLFHKPGRVERLDACHFWLSETPDKPGSKSWDTAITRMCTWGRFKIADREFCVFNAHFDHRGEEARRQSALLLRSRVDEMAPVPCVVLGDFNATPGSPPHKALVGEDGLLDTGTALDADPATAGTFHNFTGNTDGGRIDWILLTNHWKLIESRIDHSHRDNRYPSDHFPVIADVAMQS